MSFSLEEIQEDILAFLGTTVYPGQDVIEQAVGDPQVRGRDAKGNIIPYIAVELGDVQPWGSTSFIGPRGDDYVLPVRINCIAPTPKIARQLGNRGMDLFLGASFDWAGQIRKRVGGAVLPMKNADGATEAYVFPLAFGIVVQLMTVP